MLHYNPYSFAPRIVKNDKISVFKNSTVKEVSGFVGNFVTTISNNGEDKTVEHGAIIVATGGIEYEPTEYLYGENERVITQLEFDEKMYSNELDPATKSIVMLFPILLLSANHSVIANKLPLTPG